MSIECAFFGTVGRDAEVKTSKSGKPYLRFSVRVGDGDAAQWVTTMYFGVDADDLAPKVVKGAKVYVEGSLRLDTWEKDGATRTSLTVMSFHCRVAEIGRSKPKRERDNPKAGAAGNDFHSDDVPW